MEHALFLLLIIYSALAIRVLFTQIEVSFRIHQETNLPLYPLVKFCVFYSICWPVICSKDPLGFMKIYLLGQQVSLSMVRLESSKE